MALSYGFFDAELTPSGQYDRAYAAEQFAEYFHLIVSNGVFPDPATQLQVVASDTPNMNVNVSDGYGWINGYYAKNSGPYPLAIQAASGTLNRIDAVVLRWVNASRSMELAVKTGIAASSPATPALQRDTDVYELMLATVTVAAGATSIPQSSITDKRSDTSVCGWVTGAVQNIDTTNLFAQYDTAFQEWFDNIKSQLSGDVATNLQNQINKNAAGIATINTTTLKADTKTALGLPASAGPDDAFKVLANVGNLHVWERVQSGVTDYLTSTDRDAYPDNVTDAQDAYYTLGEPKTTVIPIYPGNNVDPFYYGDVNNVVVTDDGVVSVSSGTYVSLSPYNTNNTDSLKGKYIQGHPTGHPVTSVYYIPADATFSNANGELICDKAQLVTGYAAIPANTTITYLGQLGGGARIEVGSYVGTGTYGSSNPNSLTASFPIKIAIIGNYKSGSTDVSATAIFLPVGCDTKFNKHGYFLSDYDSAMQDQYKYSKISKDGKTLYWYDSRYAKDQLNVSTRIYFYVLIG